GDRPLGGLPGPDLRRVRGDRLQAVACENDVVPARRDLLKRVTTNARCGSLRTTSLLPFQLRQQVGELAAGLRVAAVGVQELRDAGELPGLRCVTQAVERERVVIAGLDPRVAPGLLERFELRPVPLRMLERLAGADFEF